MQVSSRELGPVAILDLDGRLTVDEDSRRLNQQLNVLIKRNTKYFVINLHRVTDIDCSGIGQLMACNTKVCKQQGKLKLLNLGEKMRSLLENRRLLTVFELFNSEEEAVASFDLQTSENLQKSTDRPKPTTEATDESSQS